MAAFAIHLCQFFKHPDARIGMTRRGRTSDIGQLETDMLQHFTNRSEVECRGSETEVNVRVTEAETACQSGGSSVFMKFTIYIHSISGITKYFTFFI